MMSQLTRQLVGRATWRAHGVSKSVVKASSGSRTSGRRLTQIYGQRRAFSTDTPPLWTPEDLAVLGTFKGTPTPRGIKKTSTGLTGLHVQPEARLILIELYKKIAAELTKLPEDYAYRVESEDYVRRRLSILLEETDVIRLEEEMDAGQLESLILEAEDELHHVLPTLAEMKPWATPLTKWEKKRPMLYTDVKVS